MEWIKVTPETMPPAMCPVMVTVRSKKDPDFVDLMKNVLWNPEYEDGWCWDDGADCYVYLDDNMEVTHWMPYPEPAKD